MENPVVKVTDISNLLGEDLPTDKQVDLGDSQLNEKVNSFLDVIKKHSNKAYVLRWEGKKIPRGAVVDGETIAWTQNGQVHNGYGEIVGHYDRIVEFGGVSDKEQVMIVYRH